MIPPTSIDGTDITGATIDGTDVQEITVDGDVVFTAREFPVAFSNLVAWWPFDSSFYGGANTDDATGGDGSSGDSTSYDTVQDGTVTFQSSGGAKDINTGDASGYAEFDSQDGLDAGTTELSDFGDNNEPFSYCAWAKFDNLFDDDYKPIMGDTIGHCLLFHQRSGLNRGAGWEVKTDGTLNSFESGSNLSNNEWFHLVGTFDGSSNFTLYIDGNDKTTFTETRTGQSLGDFYIGNYGQSSYDAAPNIDDVRVYDKELSSSEVSQIFSNTKPSSKP